jgi:O-antigen/teichoic acid export membrane protein
LSALHEERERLKSWYVRAQRVVLLSHGAFVALVLPFSGPLTRVLLGPTWMPIVPALRLLVVAMWLRSMVAMVGTLLNAVGQPRLTYRLQAVRLAIMAATIYPLSQLMGGLEGVAAAVLLSLIAAAVLSLMGVRRTLGVGLMDQLRQLVPRG